MNAKRRDYVKAWMTKADHDLKNVANNIKAGGDDLPTDTMCFHCQQAVEKYLKAFLFFHDVAFRFTHNLADLVTLCMSVDHAFSAFLKKAELLSPFAVEIRYPEMPYMPTLEEMHALHAIALEIKAFVRARIPFTKEDDGKEER